MFNNIGKFNLRTWLPHKMLNWKETSVPVQHQINTSFSESDVKLRTIHFYQLFWLSKLLEINFVGNELCWKSTLLPFMLVHLLCGLKYTIDPDHFLSLFVLLWSSELPASVIYQWKINPNPIFIFPSWWWIVFELKSRDTKIWEIL